MALEERKEKEWLASQYAEDQRKARTVITGSLFEMVRKANPSQACLF